MISSFVIFFSHVRICPVRRGQPSPPRASGYICFLICVHGKSMSMVCPCKHDCSAGLRFRGQFILTSGSHSPHCLPCRAKSCYIVERFVVCALLVPYRSLFALSWHCLYSTSYTVTICRMTETKSRIETTEVSIERHHHYFVPSYAILV